MAEGLSDYASPILRAAVFRQLFPGAQISYTVVPIGQAFPMGHTEYEGKATEAVRCEIIFAEGNYIVAHKEIDKKDNRNRDVVQTPENMAKDETKALGRALRDAGIPQRLSELKILMSWITSMDGQPNVSSLGATAPKTTTIGEDILTAFPGTEEDDSPDAGAEDPTTEQILARKFAFLNGTDKQAIVAYAREELGISNVLRAGDKAEELLAYITNEYGQPPSVEGGGSSAAIPATPPSTPDKRAKAAASLLPDEEPF